jgi:hypothetical protein
LIISKIKEKFASNQLRILSTSNSDTAIELLKDQMDIDFLVVSCESMNKDIKDFLHKNNHIVKTICIFNEADYDEMQILLQNNLDDFCLKTTIETTLSQVLNRLILNE